MRHHASSSACIIVNHHASSSPSSSSSSSSASSSSGFCSNCMQLQPQANTCFCCFVDRYRTVKSSPAWHRKARAARARARRASRRGHITEFQRLRILDHHGSEMTKNARQKWCVKCFSWKWAYGTKCYCRANESGNALAGWSDLSDASRQDLQATLKKLEAAKQNTAAAPQAVSALEERMQQVKDAIYRYDPLHVQISTLQTAIGRAEGTVKNRKEQLWQSQEALTKAQDHLWELQRRLEEVTLQRKEEEDQGYDAMNLQDGPGSWWDTVSPGLDDDEEHARESSPQSWRSWGGYQDQSRQDWHKSQCALEDLSVKLRRCSSTLATSQRSTAHSRQRSCWRFKP